MHTKQALALGVAAFSTLALASPVTLNLTTEGLIKRGLSEVICGFYPSASEDLGYVCNDQDVMLFVPMNEVLDNLIYLAEVCVDYHLVDIGPPGGTGLMAGTNMPGSGRVRVTDRDGYNVNIGYCNGNDGDDVSPSAYGWPGPNGEPWLQCGKDGQVPCPGTGCIEGSLVVESQEAIACQDYLGAGYIGVGATYIYSSTRQVGTTWTVGGFLSIDTSDLAPVSVQADFFASFAETTTIGSSTGVGDTCGSEDAEGDYTCGLHIRPQCYAMTGYCDTEATGRVPWANVVPQTSSDGVGVFTSEICICENCPGFDDTIDLETAPDAVCHLPCAGCMP
ncbi:uncharacterized protein LTR77_008616 [Saxophila tyrrhenica]|uniref:Uncharacterized protein n=1 Tax=Saxophila tyrrhenica TaxID=1690608 RepID=A0AAV9P333_9PEZI|nr:hypothetical protein LTR77_008616 [Saxophila tyrrhenica]